MFKKVLLFVALCCCCLIGRAQQDDPGKSGRIRLGVKGGAHFSGMHWSELDGCNTGGINSGAGGFFAEFDLGERRRFSIRPEVVFLSRGSDVSGVDAYGDDFDYRLKAKYTDIRVPIVWNIVSPDRVSPYLYVAPIFSFARGGNVDYTTYFMDEAEHWPSLDASNANLAKFDFSAAVGVGVRVPIKITDTKRLHLSFEANYQYGFIDTYGSKEKDGSAIALNRNVYNISGTRKNRGFEITAAVSVPLSIFKRTKKKEPEPVYVPEPVVEQIPEPVVEKVEEKPCYSLDEIMQMLDEHKSIEGKTICAIEQISFAFGKSEIDSSSFGYLDNIVLLLKQGDMNMEIKGHTDNVGNADFNMELSRKRAKAVYDYLVGKGVDRSRLSYSYYGMEDPIASNDTEEGRKANRRVEFEILNKQNIK